MQAKELARRIALAALSKKAEEIKIFDLRGLSNMTDFFVICTGSTDLHTRAIQEAIVEELKKEEALRPWHIEGAGIGRWILIDYVDVVVHIFQPEVREFYGLERLWGDAEVEEISDENIQA